MRGLVRVAVAMLVSCSSEHEQVPCDLAHRDGAYGGQISERPSSSSCGAIADKVLLLGGDAPAPEVDCIVDGPDSVSADQCSVTRRFTCTVEGEDSTITGSLVTTERDGGARLTGIYHVIMHDGAGAFVCQSTYDASLEASQVK